MKFLKKLKIELTYDPVIPLLSIYPDKKHGSKGEHVYTLTHIAHPLAMFKLSEF